MVDLIGRIITLLNRLTAARAALLDQITAARMAELDAANLPADIDVLKASKDRQLFSMDFWSARQEEVALTAAAAGDKALPRKSRKDFWHLSVLALREN
jgi:hypothetical protein